ncbi:hypothetical protein [Dactylosporangium sp. NPDC000521]|uniref:hypothetical protein n=1 Tax=Dactylosporangium sp. NPDC000521 TaxID=3363975 RepID=UPI003684AFDA
MRGLRWFAGIFFTLMTAGFALALWLTWQDAHGGEAVATVQRVDQHMPIEVDGVAITADAWPTGLPPWSYTSVFVLPDGTRCETTARLYPEDRHVVVGDATTVHYSRWQPCSNFQRADRPRPAVTDVLTWGASMLVIGLLVFAGLAAAARSRPTYPWHTLGTSRETGPEDHWPAGSARRLPGWRP